MVALRQRVALKEKVPEEGETGESCRDAGEQAGKVPVHDDEHLEKALGTILQNGVDRLDGLDLLQLVAHFMAWYVVNAFEEVEIAIGDAH